MDSCNTNNIGKRKMDEYNTHIDTDNLDMKVQTKLPTQIGDILYIDELDKITFLETKRRLGVVASDPDENDYIAIH